MSTLFAEVFFSGEYFSDRPIDSFSVERLCPLFLLLDLDELTLFTRLRFFAAVTLSTTWRNLILYFQPLFVHSTYYFTRKNSNKVQT